MPELPDIELYLHCLRRRVDQQQLQTIRISSPFVLRSVEPDIFEAEHNTVHRVHRLGKRVVFELDDDLNLVIHLMIAGRFRWHDTPPSTKASKIELARFTFDSGVLVLTEAGSKKRASMHLVRGTGQLAEHDRGGLEVMDCSLEQFTERLREENHTIKRSLTDPRFLSGIGNAYSDEILHQACLSPLLLTQRMTDEQYQTLFDATRMTLETWIDRLIEQTGDGFPGPGQVTAFRPEMAVHGRFEQPCPVCQTAVQRIVRGDRETNYCPRCQTGGKLLADRSLSRLLKDLWPKTVDEIE